MRDALRGLLVVAAVALGALAGAAAMPVLFRTLPHDLRRIPTVVDALRTRQPEIVVFGDSRAEAAVDAAQLSRELPGRPLAFNLATPDGTLGQTLLLAGALPQSVRRVVQFVTPEMLSREDEPEEVVHALALSGLPIDFRPLERCGVGSGPPNGWRARFASRWVVRQAADQLVRGVIRPELRLETERTSLEFPSIYATRVSGARFDAEVALLRESRYRGARPGQLCILATLAQRLRAGNRTLLLVLPPRHAGWSGPDEERFIEEVHRLSRVHSIPMIDLGRAVPPGLFADPRHVRHDGARLATSALARRMEALR
jgi:hypothetical protein